jgi:hypothetical protein
MSGWQLHWLEAEGDLTVFRPKVEAELKITRNLISRMLSPPRLDIIVQRLTGQVIPEIGMVGHAFRKSMFALTLDPENPNSPAACRMAPCNASWPMRFTTASVCEGPDMVTLSGKRWSAKDWRDGLSATCSAVRLSHGNAPSARTFLILTGLMPLRSLHPTTITQPGSLAQGTAGFRAG